MSSDCMTLDEGQTGCIHIVRYANLNFNSVEINPLEFWRKLRKLAANKVHWRDTMLVIELCLWAPFSNATLEQFFNGVKDIKCDKRSRLSQKRLNPSLNIRLLEHSLSPAG